MISFLAQQFRGENTPWARDYGAPLEQFTRAYWLVRAFYVATLYMAYEDMSVLWRIARTADSIEPLWPVFWVSEPRIAGTGLLIALMFAALLGVLCTYSRLVRLLVFVTILQATAYRFSFGAINHSNHFWLWTAFCFTFLPSGSVENLVGPYRRVRPGAAAISHGFLRSPGPYCDILYLVGPYQGRLGSTRIGDGRGRVVLTLRLGQYDGPSVVDAARRGVHFRTNIGE